jgi:PAS domain S-box-containing protein
MVESVQSPVEIVVDSAEKAKLHILHVDDEPSLLRVAKQCLEMQGPFQVDTAESVEEALGKLGKGSYDAIVSDYRMPGKDGLEFLKELRQGGNAIPFIVFTGKGKEEVAIKALNLGADRYLNKAGDSESVYCELAKDLRAVVESKRAEMDVWREKERLRAIFVSSPDGIMINDLNGNVIDCNEAALELGGYSSARCVIGKNAIEFLAEKDRSKALENLRKMSEQGTMKNVEYTALKMNGETYVAELSGSILNDSRGNPVGFVNIIRDVSERKKAENTLMESEKKYHSLYSSMSEGFCLHEIVYDGAGGGAVDYIILDVNPAFESLTGIKREEAIGSKASALYGAGEPPYLGIYARVAASGEPASFETFFPPMNKQFQISVFSPSRGKFATVFHEVTERKKAEQESRRFSAAIRASLDGIVTGDLNGNIADVNEALLRMFGSADKSDLIGKNVLDFLVEGDRARALQDSMESMKTGQGKTIEYRALTKNGTEIPVEITTGFIKGEQGEPIGFVDIVRNITERKKAENRAYTSQKKFESLFMGNPEAAVYLGSDFSILDINPRFEELFGYSLAEIKGKHLVDLIVQMDKMEEAETLDRKASDGYVYHNTVRRRKDGALVPVAVSAAPMKFEGTVVGYVGVYKDISELKRTEAAMKEMMQKLATMNEKLQVVGGLTRHDIRNKLSVITGNIFLEKKWTRDNPELLESFKDMESACGQIVRILDFARNYELLGVEELTYTDVHEAVQKAVSLFSDLKGAKVSNECQGLNVLADSLLRQMFYNLVDNSLKYGCKVSQIRIFRQQVGEDGLRIVYQDDGIGIPQNVRPNLFREGFSTGGGSGYGLFLIKTLMDVYGWRIEETGESGKGAQFTITIPRTAKNGKENYRIE